MDLTVILTGLFVLALFVLPFYFVTRSRSDESKTEPDTGHLQSTPHSESKKKKQHK